MPAREGRPTRYPVLFRERNEPPSAGALVIGVDALLLEGGPATAARTLTVPFADVSEVRVARSRDERLNGYPVLVLERFAATPVQIAPLGMGLLTEIAALLYESTGEPQTTEQATVVVPLKANCEGQIRSLVEQGPPFDPRDLGLEHHAVYLANDEIVFVFVGPGANAAIEHAMRRPTLWRAGLAWRNYIAGAPRRVSDAYIPEPGAELLYTWTADR